MSEKRCFWCSKLLRGTIYWADDGRGKPMPTCSEKCKMICEAKMDEVAKVKWPLVEVEG